MSDKKRFDYDLYFGKLGEIRFYSYIKFNEGFTGIDDVSNVKQFQDLDVDFILHQKNGNDLWVEVKNDKETDNTGHIVYELTSNGNIGCLARSKADIVFYLTRTKMYYFELDKVRKYIDIIKPEVRKMGDGATGYLLELSDLIRNNLINEVQEKIDYGNLVRNS